MGHFGFSNHSEEIDDMSQTESIQEGNVSIGKGGLPPPLNAAQASGASRPSLSTRLLS